MVLLYREGTKPDADSFASFDPSPGANYLGYAANGILKLVDLKTRESRVYDGYNQVQSEPDDVGFAPEGVWLAKMTGSVCDRSHGRKESVPYPETNARFLNGQQKGSCCAWSTLKGCGKQHRLEQGGQPMKQNQPESLPRPEADWVRKIQKELLTWYDQNRRGLPWRENKDPYRIWVSEIMLQQTRVDTVIPYYEQFVSAFPTVKDLAEAPEDQVIKAWEGLGYYSRARNLHAAAKEVMEQYKGEIPREPEKISRLKGVGSYTAGAILSIAYDLPVPAVDGNVMRVLSRWFAWWEDISKAATRRRMEAVDRELIPAERPGDFNQAMMELGALICTPVSPSCDTCPVRELCQAQAEGLQEELPVKKKGKPPVPMEVTFGWIRRGDQVLLHRRPQGGLLGGMWGLPTIEHWQGSLSLEEALKTSLAELGLKVEPGSILGELEHVFSHRRWYVTVVEALEISGEDLTEDYRWVQESELDNYALPNVYRKAVQLATARQHAAGIQGRLF